MSKRAYFRHGYLRRWRRRRLTTAGKVYVVMVILSLAVCLVWASSAVIGRIRDAKSAARAAELRIIHVEEPETFQSSRLPDLSLLYEQNHDLAGWLSIEGTQIDYPVMFRADDEKYYLSHNFDREKDENGALLIQAGCDPFTQGGNIIIHGHNMKNGEMFGSLEEYEEEAYFRKHPVLRFDTLYEQGEYEIVAVFLTQVYRKNENVFKYYQVFSLESQTEFDEFYSNIKALALYDTGKDAAYGDSFLMLSTCAYHVPNGRFVVVARKAQNEAAYP